MQARSEDLQGLLEVQAIDIELLHARKDLDSLPQRAAIMAARKKRDAINEKHSKVEQLKKEASKRLSCINDEDDSLQKKENGVQAAIQAAGVDFRNAEARSKELEGISKRRASLAEERAKIDKELEKIGNLEIQLALALDEVDKMENEATASFQHDGGELKSRIAKLEADKDALLSKIDESIVKSYKKAAVRSGNVGIGKLNGSQCGVCRSTLEGGRLIELRAQAPLGVCPSCHRLLIIEDQPA